jgi:hypothetical protein
VYSSSPDQTVWGLHCDLIVVFACPADCRSITLVGFHRALASFFLPIPVAPKIFRRKFVSALQRNFRQGKIGFHGTLKPLAHPKAFSAWLRTLYRHHWHVYSNPPFGDADHAVRYLGHYTHRVAISNHRLVLADDQVTFRWRDSAHNNEQKLMTLSLDEFLTRFLLHLLPKDFVRIRHFGFLATDAAPLSCRFAFDYSEPYSHRRPKQKPPLPRNRAHFGSVPNVAAAWCSSRHLRLPRSNSVLHPFSPELPHDTKIPISLLGASHHPLAWCALRAPKPAPHFQPRLKLSHSERGFIGIFEVFHEYPLEFEGYLLSCAKMPSAKESDPN